MTLGLRLGRRFVAAAGFEDEAFRFQDCRYVGSRRQISVTMAAYFSRLLEQSRPDTIYAFAPSPANSTTGEILGLLEAAASKAGVVVKRLTKSDLFRSFGPMPLGTRAELRTVMLQLWPQLTQSPELRQRSLAEAAAAALVGDLREAWPPV